MAQFTTTATITGMSELMSKFKALDEAVQAQALERAAIAGALPIQNYAQQKSPKKTRTLERSIHTEVVESSNTEVTVEIGTDVVYAAIQEFGGTIHQTNAWGKGIETTITIPPHPYMRPAFDTQQAAAAESAGNALRQLIVKAAGGEA
jgi:HK97 gp10 family phage protein